MYAGEERIDWILSKLANLLFRRQIFSKSSQSTNDFGAQVAHFGAIKTIDVSENENKSMHVIRGYCSSLYTLKGIIKVKYRQDACEVGDEGGFILNVHGSREGLITPVKGIMKDKKYETLVDVDLQGPPTYSGTLLCMQSMPTESKDVRSCKNA
uniref:Enolase C-terminal TIM barrel domain-containing protein n=1 Tax=Solanum lycopersicum TaxID=4081 RepID=A0A3Q7EZ54_SOLLC